MSSRLRTVLILAAVAIAGFAALATMAERYRRMTPERSVLDLPTEARPPAVTAPAAAPEPAVVEIPQVVEAAPPIAREEPDVPEEPEVPEVPEEPDVAAAEKFLEVRGAIREYVAANPRAARKVAAIVEAGEATAKTRPADPRFLAGYRGARVDALARAAMSAEEYERVRASFAAWRKGEGKDPIAAAFAAKGDAAAQADLGALEALDYEISL